MKRPPTHARLREVLHYEPATGQFTWRVHKGSRARAGQPAGAVIAIHDRRYLMIGVDARRCYAHALAWLYMTGQWPTEQVCFQNGDTLDLRFANLAEETPAQVEQRRTDRHSNATGFAGVKARHLVGKLVFDARIKINGRRVVLGSFSTARQAHEAYVAAKRQHHGIEI